MPPSQPRAPQSRPSQLSKERIESSDEEEQEGSIRMEDQVESENDHDDDGSVDSHEDIEDIRPRKKDKAPRDEHTRTIASGSKAPRLPKFTPPMGYQPMEMDINVLDTHFEYSSLASNPKLQLWIVRAPKDLKTSKLSSLRLAVPSKKSQHPTGTLSTRHESYRLESIEDPAAERSKEAVGSSSSRMGGELAGGIRLLVPSEQHHGKLLMAPIPISQHLLLVPDEAPDNSTDLAAPMPRNEVAMEGVLPSKRQQLSHLFKFRNPAYGYNTPGPTASIDPPIIRTSPMNDMERDTPKKSKKPRKSKEIGNRTGTEERTPKRSKTAAA